LAGAEAAARAFRTGFAAALHAANLYAALGWQAVGPEVDHGHAVTLMRRDLLAG
jgi:hypothetical protein